MERDRKQQRRRGIAVYRQVASTLNIIIDLLRATFEQLEKTRPGIAPRNEKVPSHRPQQMPTTTMIHDDGPFSLTGLLFIYLLRQRLNIVPKN